MRARSVRCVVLCVSCVFVCLFSAGVFEGIASAAEVGVRQIGASVNGQPVEAGGVGLVTPTGVGVQGAASSLALGDVYVTDREEWRMNRFGNAGAFQLAWGSGVSTGAKELQTCTSSCDTGLEEEAGPSFVDGGIQFPLDVAVDSDPLSSSAGDVYVAERNPLNRVEKFGPSGEFLLMFGGEVNEAKDASPSATEAEKDVCVAGEQCGAGTEGTSNGQFDLGEAHSLMAVGPGGRVYIGDQGRVQVFEPSGVWRETISLASLSSTGPVTALAVDPAGDVFVADSEASGVHEFEAGGIEKSVQFDEGSTSIASIAVDNVGDVFVGDTNGGSPFGFHVLKYNSSGQEVDDFGARTVRGGVYQPDGNILEEPFRYDHMVFSEASGSPELYATENFTEQPEHTSEPNEAYSSVWVLPVPAPGPVVGSGSVSVSPRGTVTLEGSVNPENDETSYHFEYVSEQEFTKIAGGKPCEWACATSTVTGTVPASFEPQTVTAHVTGLSVATVYHYRLVATNSESANPAVGPDQTFTTLPALYLEALYATDVASTSATLNLTVNPLESPTEYRIEYGPTSSYGHVLTGSTGAGTQAITIPRHLQELAVSSTYHYRVVVTNELGSAESEDHTLTTQAAGGELTLPDGRAWELVSPPDKKGALIEQSALANNINSIKAAVDGGAIVYEATDAIGEGAVGKPATTSVISTRGSSGWQTRDVSMPSSVSPEGTAAGSGAREGFYTLFSPDLSVGVAEQFEQPVPALSPQATERTPYLRRFLACEAGQESCFTPILTSGDVEPASAKFGGIARTDAASVVGASPDLSHIVLESPYALTAGAKGEVEVQCVSGLCSVPNPEYNLYEWSDGHLSLVNVYPDGSSSPGTSERKKANLGITAGTGGGAVNSVHAVSEDGRWIVWSIGNFESGVGSELFVRDMQQEKTWQVGGVNADFQTMSADGSRVLYIENRELYEFDTHTGLSSDLTSGHGAGESDAGVREVVMSPSEGETPSSPQEMSYVYFVATGVLANGAASGAENMYVLHYGSSGTTITFVGALSGEDQRRPNESFYASSRVSASGRYLVFMSNGSPTGYDNRDAVSGQPDEEVYLYDAVVKRLVCMSCNPTGARPVGVLDTASSKLLVDTEHVWGNSNVSTWLAGMIPSWQASNVEDRTGASFYQPRFLSDSGRVFFDSSDALVPQATNGLMNVYEYEPASIGGCTTASSTFNASSGGCVSLISDGTSGSESDFYDASETGDDAFFITSSKLSGEDYDTSDDVYDAHVCSQSAPCRTTPVSPPPCTSGDSCKAAPTPQPEIFGPTPSATFSGTGNVTPTASKPVVRKRSLTRAQKLARALHTCRQKTHGKKRSSCERREQRRYGAKRARKANMKRGHR